MIKYTGEKIKRNEASFSIEYSCKPIEQKTASETEISEQKGFSNILVGLFGTVINPTAHAPKIVWSMSEQDALDIFSLVSFVHRKLDKASKI